MRKITLKKFGFGLFLLVFSLLFQSCGSTKKHLQEQSVQKQNQTLVVTDQSTTAHQNVKIETTEAKEANSQTVTIKKTYTPILPDKKAVAIDSQGKRVELDNASLVEETILHQDKEQVRQSGKTEAVQNKATQTKQELQTKAIEKSKELDKVVDRKGIHFSFWIWLVLVAIVVLAVTYLKYRFKWLTDVTT